MLFARVGCLAFVSLVAIASAVEAPKSWPADAFLPVTADRIAALPASVQPAWKAYWEESAARAKRLPPRELAERPNLKPLSTAPTGASFSQGVKLDASYTWYANDVARGIADRVVSWQTATGGWTKDGDYSRTRQASDDHANAWSGGTFDNNSTIYEMRFLALVLSADPAVPAERMKVWRESFLRGLDYVFAAQYPNGGFPQIYPLAGGYHDAITFNDDALVHILELLRDIGERQREFEFVPADLAATALRRFQRGLSVILAMQLVTPDGQRTVWGQQHDALTLEPCAARNFEPIAQCARESAGLVKFLMSHPAPTAEIILAVDSAMRWFEANAIRDRYWDRNAPAGTDLTVKPGAPDLWARFYEIGTNKPIYGDRDRSVHYTLKEISFERRKGYMWFSSDPGELRPYYFYWQHKVAKNAAR